MIRASPTWPLIALGGLWLTTSLACVAPGTGATPAPAFARPSACEGPQPTCIDACSTSIRITESRCEDGLWRCELGVRSDLCCDPLDAPEQCPEWADLCTPSSPCANGYTCVGSRNWPLPSDEGVCRLGDWSIPAPLGNCAARDVLAPDFLPGLPPAAIKLEGIISVAMRCDDRECDLRTPCCQRCIGNYALDMLTRDGTPVSIGLHTETLSCVGTNCGFSCAPMQPGRRYRVWGLWLPDTGASAPGTLYVAGTCAE